MEATSDYWRIWFAVLEEAGLAVQLVNSSQARNLPGRPKTDKEDARWIARLTEMGMLRSSFVPPPEIRALRVYTRHIWDLTADRTQVLAAAGEAAGGRPVQADVRGVSSWPGTRPPARSSRR